MRKTWAEDTPPTPRQKREALRQLAQHSLALLAVLLAFHFIRSAYDSSEEAAGRVMVLAEVFLASSSRKKQRQQSKNTGCALTHSEQNGSFWLLFRGLHTVYAHCSDAQTSVNSGSRSLVHTREILEYASRAQETCGRRVFVFAASYKASKATHHRQHTKPPIQLTGLRQHHNHGEKSTQSGTASERGI